MNQDVVGRLYASFADLLSYPASSIFDQADDCLAQLQDLCPEAVSAFEHFLRGLRQCELEKLMELYTTTFDMQPVCYPYIGYQLFGESYKRGALMAQLNETYRAFGFSAERELPDHIAVTLRFLGLDAANREGEFCQSLLRSGLIPALEKMIQPFGAESENPYFWLLIALQHFLVQIAEKEFDHAR